MQSINRRGTPAKPARGKKQPKVCPACGKKFWSRRRFAEHLVLEKALAAFEAAREAAASRVWGPGETIPRSEIMPERVEVYGAELATAGIPEGVAKDLAGYARRGMLEGWS